MSDARLRERWTHTASVLAMLANTHRNPKKSKPFKPGDFDPFERQPAQQSPIPTADLSVLKAVFVDRGMEESR